MTKPMRGDVSPHPSPSPVTTPLIMIHNECLSSDFRVLHRRVSLPAFTRVDDAGRPSLPNHSDLQLGVVNKSLAAGLC